MISGKCLDRVRCILNIKGFNCSLKGKNPLQEISISQLTTVVFGLRSSHFLAIHTLKQLVKDEGANYPLAAAALEKLIYVDEELVFVSFYCFFFGICICFLVPIL